MGLCGVAAHAADFGQVGKVSEGSFAAMQPTQNISELNLEPHVSVV